MMGTPKKSEVPTSKPQQTIKEEESTKLPAVSTMKKRDFKRKCKQQSNHEEAAQVSEPSPVL